METHKVKSSNDFVNLTIEGLCAGELFAILKYYTVLFVINNPYDVNKGKTSIDHIIEYYQTRQSEHGNAIAQFIFSRELFDGLTEVSIENIASMINNTVLEFSHARSAISHIEKKLADSGVELHVTKCKFYGTNILRLNAGGSYYD